MSTETFNFYPDKSYLSLVTCHLSLLAWGKSSRPAWHLRACGWPMAASGPPTHTRTTAAPALTVQLCMRGRSLHRLKIPSHSVLDIFCLLPCVPPCVPPCVHGAWRGFLRTSPKGLAAAFDRAQPKTIAFSGACYFLTLWDAHYTIKFYIFIFVTNTCSTIFRVLL